MTTPDKPDTEIITLAQTRLFARNPAYKALLAGGYTDLRSALTDLDWPSSPLREVGEALTWKPIAQQPPVFGWYTVSDGQRIYRARWLQNLGRNGGFGVITRSKFNAKMVSVGDTFEHDDHVTHWTVDLLDLVEPPK